MYRKYAPWSVVVLLGQTAGALWMVVAIVLRVMLVTTLRVGEAKLYCEMLGYCGVACFAVSHLGLWIIVGLLFAAYSRQLGVHHEVHVG